MSEDADQRTDNVEVAANPPASEPIVETTVSNASVLPPAAPPVPPSVLASLSHLGLGVSIQQEPRQSDALLKKMTESHISQVIEATARNDERKSRERLVNTGAAVLLVTLGAITIVALCVIFLRYDKPEYIQGIVGLLVGLVSGGVGGFGWGRYTAPKEKDSKD